MRDFEAEEALKRAQRELRRAAIRREQMRKTQQRRMLVLGCAGICILFLAIVGVKLLNRKTDTNDEVKNQSDSQSVLQIEEAENQVANSESLSQVKDTDIAVSVVPKAIEFIRAKTEDMESKDEDSPEDSETTQLFADGYQAEVTDATVSIESEDILSTYALLIDLDNNTIIAQKNPTERISPASMTKILTVLVAAEHIDNLDDTFTITREITDYSYRNDCSAAGFDVGETVTVRDLLYGTILPSGADAAAGLAYYVSGSLEGFTELMNEKIAQLGLSDTAHFTNCVGLYDENHYCTIYDMAIMLKAAVENDLCREVLSRHIYTTSPTEQHPEGIELSNWFLRRIEDKETNGEVVCAKTGYVVQSGNCAASYSVSNNGKHYVCVTANAYSGWRCIYDHVAIYQQYTE